MLPEVIFDPFQKAYPEGEALGLLAYVGEHSGIKDYDFSAHLSIDLIEHVDEIVVVTLYVECIFDIEEPSIGLRWKESYFLRGTTDILVMLREEPSLDSCTYNRFESLCCLEYHPVSYIINFS